MVIDVPPPEPAILDRDEITPRGTVPTIAVASVPVLSQPIPPRKPSQNRSSTASFNSLYDVSSSSDDEHIDAFFLQLKCSDSIKHSSKTNSDKYDMVIPDADKWPSIQSFRKALYSGEVSPNTRLPLSPSTLAKLSKLASESDSPPPKDSIPSLVDSSADDHSASCPSTPDPHGLSPSPPPLNQDWPMPLQLNPLAMETLQSISPDDLDPDAHTPQATEVPAEMQSLGLDLAVVTPRTAIHDDTTPISELSLPSPGGFFASLNEAARQSWLPVQSPTAPNSATAELFYFFSRPPEVPHPQPPGDRPAPDPEHHLKDSSGQKPDQRATEAGEPPTSRQNDYQRKNSISASEVEEISIRERFEYDENYGQKLLDTASVNMARTSRWLSAQASYISSLARVDPSHLYHRSRQHQRTEGASHKSPRTSSPGTSSQGSPEAPRKSRLLVKLPSQDSSGSLHKSQGSTGSRIESPKSQRSDATATPATSRDAINSTRPAAKSSSPDTNSSSPKKKVRFSKYILKSNLPEESPTSPKNDSLFYHAFQYMYRRGGKHEALLYADTRCDAIDMQRRYIPKTHLSQIVGDRTVNAESPKAATFSGLPERPDDARAEAQRIAIALAKLEQQALEQIRLSVWNIEGMRELNGGSLLDKPAVKIIKERHMAGEEPLILDLGGEPTADWGWAVALEHRNASVYTAVATSPISPTNWQAHRGPSNHRTVRMKSAWSLPFASESFDVVSARTLHTLLHTNRQQARPSPKPPFAQDLGSMRGRHTPRLDTSAAAVARADAARAAREPPSPDEYTLALAEIHRVLRPGGVLQFRVLDAELFYPSPFGAADAAAAPPRSPTSQLAALSINFAEALKSAAYDPTAAEHFLPRLGAAGFTKVSRAWTVLPASAKSFCRPGEARGLDISPSLLMRARPPSEAAGTTSNEGIAGLAGLVGGLEWERWMVGLAAEMGRDGDKVVERLGRVLGDYRRHGPEEPGKGAGWRCLHGWCRKPLV